MQINSQKKLKITERILLILENKNITKYRFHKDLGLSNGFLDKKREITTEKYAKILDYFPDVNPNWLLKGEEDMYKKTTEKQQKCLQCSEYQKKIIKLQDEIIELKNELLQIYKAHFNK